MAAGVGSVAVVLGERWVRGTRATPGERAAPLPGDELVPEPKWQATRAITIGASRREVWPWLVQMGFPTHRAGWYTPYWTDRLLFGITARSADRIISELQDLAVGDRVSDSERGNSFFTVDRIEAERALVLRSSTHPLPAYRDVNFVWAFVLEDLPEGTRLVVRARLTYSPVWPAAVVRALMIVGFGAGDVLQAGAMLHGIRRRAERPRPGAPEPRDAPAVATPSSLRDGRRSTPLRSGSGASRRRP